MSSGGLTNQAFTDVGRKLSQHSLRISLKLNKNNEGKNTDKNETSEDPSQEQIENKYYGNTDDNISTTKNSSFGTILHWLVRGATYLVPLIYFIFVSIYWNREKSNCSIGWCDGYGMLIIMVGLLYYGLLYRYVLKRIIKKSIKNILPCFESFKSDNKKNEKSAHYAKFIISSLIILIIFIFLIYDTIGSRNRLISFIGVFAILLFGWVFSKYPKQVNWRTVFCGLILQFIFGLITIRWEVGRLAFQCISSKVATFLSFAKEGSKFVFSEKLVDDKIFAFSAITVIFFFSFMIQILYYLGIMQWIIKNVGWILHSIMGTTVCESINSAANTFIGMTESPLLIKPYIKQLTSSEIHAIMCSGFATVSGTVLAAYIEFGANPANLITASVMAAPAALCFSKLFYPETEKSTTTFDNISLEKSEDTSIIDAATKGALAGIPLVLGIIANIIAFVSAVAFLNSILSWFGGLLGFEYITFEFILSKIFMPLSWMIGIPWEECEDVATLIGLKTVVNEFVAYQKLGEFKRIQRLSKRSEAIATFAICGFANPGSIGIMIGGLAAMAPEKRDQITSVALRSFIAGSLVCFMTASIAGVLMDDTFFSEALEGNSTIIN